MWTSKLYRRVFVTFALMIVVAAVLFATLVSRSHEDELRSQLQEQLRTTAVMLGELLIDQESSEALNDPERAIQLQHKAVELGKRTRTRLTLIRSDGQVVADSDRENMLALRAMDNHQYRPEIRDAMESGVGFARRFSATIEEPHFYCAVRIDHGGETLGVARTSLPVSTIRQQVRLGKQRVWTFALIVAILALIGTSWLLSRLTSPLTRLHLAVERMSAGQLHEQAPTSYRDEIGMLARAVNKLGGDLLKRIEQLRERGDQLAAVLGGMVEGVIAVDKRGRVMFANDAAGRQFDFPTDEARGRPLLTLMRDPTLHQAVKKAMATGDTVNAEIERHSPASGSLAVHVKPLPGTPCPGVVAVLYDLTRLRQLESLRQEFVANVSHELKTPLSAIKAYAETLLGGAIHDQAHNVEFVQKIEDQADRLHSLIMDLLSLARIESGDEAFEIDDIEILQAVECCLDEHRTAAESKEIRLSIDPPAEDLVLRADEEAVRQILENLVNNAIKYTLPGGEVTVCWRRDDEMAVIEVVDTGIGIEAIHVDRLFERFYRVDKARSRELGGTGLGLSIVKHLTQFFGGTVGVNSKVGHGSTFWVKLPLSNPADAPTPGSRLDSEVHAEESTQNE